MSVSAIIAWALYIFLLLYLSHLAKSSDSLLPGRVGVVIQSLAYVATYISAVALVGFAGLGYFYGLQIELIACGNIWLGVWFVYRFLAWPTRVLQKRLNARTPIELLAKGYGSKNFGKYAGLLSGVLILIYCSAVFKGGALMLTSAVPLAEHHALILLIIIVAASVLWGGLRAVLYTEAMQGLIMAIGVITLVGGTLYIAGGPINAFNALKELPPTAQANNGFLAFGSGEPGLTIIFLAIVTSVGVWAQPQVMQRHFAIKSKAEAIKVIPLAMLIISILLGGAYFAGSASRLVIGDGITSPDHVIPTLAKLILPDFGRQVFALAIVSAALSTASALLHVSCGTIGQDVFGKKLSGMKWHFAVVIGAVFSGCIAAYSSSIIALICATSWTIIASAIFVPYMGLLVFGLTLSSRSAWVSSLSGLGAALCWYAFAYAQTSMKIAGLAAPGYWGLIHPMPVGILVSALAFLVVSLFATAGAREAVQD